MSDDVYLVPRGSETVIGATVEHMGFDVTTAAVAIEGLRRSAMRGVPAAFGKRDNQHVGRHPAGHTGYAADNRA